MGKLINVIIFNCRNQTSRDTEMENMMNAKEGSSADGFKDSIERDERRLTDLGRRTIEIFVLAHIFSSRIEVAYQEAIALKRQEELIREEEAAGQAETKRAIAEKDKRTKKKQGKQRRNNRKNKEKQRDLKSDSVFHGKKHAEKSLSEIASGDLSLNHVSLMNVRLHTPEDASDVSYNCDDVAEPLYPDLGDRDSPRNWDTDESELHPSVKASASEMPNYMPERTNLGLDDTSSTCSTDSAISIGTHKANSMIINNIQTASYRSKNSGNEQLLNHQLVASHPAEILDSSPPSLHEFEGDDVPQKRSIRSHESRLIEKQEPIATLPKKTSKDKDDAAKLSNIQQLESSSSSADPGRKSQPVLQQSKQSVQNNAAATTSITAPPTAPPAPAKELPSSNHLNAPKRSTTAISPTSSSRSEAQKLHTIPSERNIAAQPATPVSRHSSAPLIPVAPRRPNTPAVTTSQVAPTPLSRSTTATSPSASDPSPFAPSYVSQSYRNAITGSNPSGFTLLNRSSASLSQSTLSSASPSLFSPPSTSRKEQLPASRPRLTFGSINPEALRAHRQSVATANTELCNSNHPREPVSAPPLYQSHGYVADEFPHLDIINDLLNEEQSTSNQYYHPLHHWHRSFSGRYSFPVDAASIDLMLGNNTSGRFDQAEQYYDDSFLSFYGGSSSARALERLQDGRLAQVDLSTAYANCQMDGLIQSQWPYNPAHLSIVNLGGTDGGGGGGGGGGGAYSYHTISDYANLGRGPNRYCLYRP